VLEYSLTGDKILQILKNLLVLLEDLVGAIRTAGGH
jgi:hypothetical protein